MNAVEVSAGNSEKIKCPLVKVVNNQGIIVMHFAVLRGRCTDGSLIIQEQGQRTGPTTKALILEKEGGWRIIEDHTKKRGKK